MLKVLKTDQKIHLLHFYAGCAINIRNRSARMNVAEMKLRQELLNMIGSFVGGDNASLCVERSKLLGRCGAQGARRMDSGLWSFGPFRVP